MSVRLLLHRPHRVLTVTGQSMAEVMDSDHPGYRATVYDADTAADWRIYGLPCKCGKGCKLLGRRVPRAGYRRLAWTCPSCHRNGSIGLLAGWWVLCGVCGTQVRQSESRTD